MRPASAPLTGVRSILETPILDAHKWSKVRDMAVDAVLLDLEDSVAPRRKAEARERVVRCIEDPRDLGGSLGLPRVNPLDSEWGYEDLSALARCGARTIVYPKLHGVGELLEVRKLLHDHGCDAGIVVIIETARAVLELEAIARENCTAGFLFGPSDLAEDVGWSLFSGDGLFADAYHYPKSKLALAGAAYDIPVYDTVFVPDLRNTGQVERAVRSAHAFGFTGMTTFYPPHLETIHAIFTPSAGAIADARAVVAAYEDALAKGAGALQVDGRAIIVQDYKRARRLLEDARTARRGDRPA